MRRHGFLRWPGVMAALAASLFWSGTAIALTCADLAGRWSGPWTFIGPRADTPKSTLTVVVAPDCTYIFSGRYWNGQIRTPGYFTISGGNLSYRNEAGSYGPVTYRKSGGGASLHFVQAQGNYVATVTKSGR